MNGHSLKKLPADEGPDPRNKMAFLAEAARDLSSTLDLDTVFEKIAEDVRPLIDYQLFCVMLWNEEQELLEHSFSLRYGERLEQTGGFPLSHGITGNAAAKRRPIRVPDVSQDSRYVRARHPEVEIRSEMAVPLLFKGRLVGVLDLESTELDYFTEEHEHMVETLASHMAIALDNASLHGRVLAEERRLEEDLATAREIQKGLLPGGAPRFPGIEIGVSYSPARELAGDFYDFLPVGDGRLALVVGDVAGKATPAALYASLAVGLLRGHALHNSPESPTEIFQHLNQQLLLPRVRNRFLAMVLGIYCHQGKTLTLANAGIPWPYLVRDGQVDKIQIEGLPLGLMPDARYEELQIDLQSGDIVVLCSDGLMEFENERKEYFGERYIPKQLTSLADSPAQVIAEGLVRAGHKHAGTVGQPVDDCTVVVLKVS